MFSMDVQSSSEEHEVFPCPDLDLSETSHTTTLIPPGLDEPSFASSARDLSEFEALENASAQNSSFTSTASYAVRFWKSRHPVLLPPCSFEELIDLSEPENLAANPVVPTKQRRSYFEPLVDSDARNFPAKPEISEFASEPNAEKNPVSGEIIFESKALDADENESSFAKQSLSEHRIAPEARIFCPYSEISESLLDSGSKGIALRAEIYTNGKFLGADENEENLLKLSADPEDGRISSLSRCSEGTRSLASVSEFRDSLPVVNSTPLKNPNQVSDEMEDKETGGNIVAGENVAGRRLFSDPNGNADTYERVFNVKAVRNVGKVGRGGKVTVRDAGANSARLRSARSTIVSEGSLAKELQDKLAELKAEVARFKTENSKLVKARLEYDAGSKQLQKERVGLDKERCEKLALLDELRRNELKKLDMEKKIMHRQIASQKVDDNRQLTEMNQHLTQEVENLREEMKKMEGRHQSANERLRQRIKILESETDKLKDHADALEEDKQELLREVVRLTRHRGKGDVTEEVHRDSNVSKSDLLPRTVAPLPSCDSLPDRFSSDESRSSSARPILKSPESSPPSTASSKSVRFDVHNAGLASTEEEAVSEELVQASGTVEQTFRDGRKLRIYKNGTKTEISRDGKSVTTSYCNGDVKQVLPDKEVYYYSANQTVQTTFPDGTQLYQFSNNQTEKLMPDGSKEITCPNMVVKTIFPSGNEQVKYPDGNMVFWNEKAQTRTVCFVNGEVELHTPQWKQRKFPDGSEKTVFADGRSESRYANGRVRIKDPSGKLIFDTKASEEGKTPVQGNDGKSPRR